MTLSHNHQTNRLLGYPDDARLLIVNADDFGVCNAVNEAIMRTLEAGLVRSTTLMAPCPWALQAMHFLHDHPALPFGIHLTAISDPADYRWGPVTPHEQVPSLVDRDGYFYNFDGMPAFLAQVKPGELEMEFRAQIETALRFGLSPDHLDWHALRIGGRTDLIDLMVRLALEYGLALRVMGRQVIESLQARGLPTIDYDFLDSYLLGPAAEKPARYTQLLHALPEGLSEWAVHPGLDTLELQAIDPGGSRTRQADYEFWMSPEARKIVEAEGIILLDYRALQGLWKKGDGLAKR